MIPLPKATDDPNVRALARLQRDNATGIAAATWTLTGTPVEALLMIWKNGLLLTPTTDYTVAGAVVTFGVPLIVGDKVTALYWARSN